MSENILCEAVYLPKCYVHKFLTFEQNSEVSYHMSGSCDLPALAVFIWGDPAFKIAWLASLLAMLENDRTWPAFLKNSALSS